MVEGYAVDDASAKPVHMFKATFDADEKARKRPFGPPGPISDAFVDELLARGTGYDAELTYVLSVIAGWSYSDGKLLARQLKYYGLAGASVDEIAMANPAMSIVATAFFIRSKCGRVGILSFRGTEPTNIINWLVDADVSSQPFSNTGCVHRGFYVNVRSLWEDIQAALHAAIGKVPANGNGGEAERRAPLERLYITGHSLGGAMAVLAAAKIYKDEPVSLVGTIAGIYTFGQPAVGDQAFADHYEKLFGDRLYRHNYHFDAVPRLPPASTGEYVHFGGVHVSAAASDGWGPPKAKSPPTRLLVWTALSVFGSFVARRIPALTWIDSRLFKYSVFDDHNPTRYIETCRAAISKNASGRAEPVFNRAK